MNVIMEICNAFGSKASIYDATAVVQREIGGRLFERLDYLKIDPRFILDLGCGPGEFSARLKSKYPKATIISFDIALNMLMHTKKKQSWRKKWPLICGDMHALPFRTGSFDLIFASQVIHWAIEIPSLFRELNRIMSPNGCIMFSTLGPDTFKELRYAFSNVDTYSHTNEFMDLHHLGDILVSEQWLDPVIDMEMLHAHYSDLEKLLIGLKSQGVRNINTARPCGLMGRQRWCQFEAAYSQLVTSTGAYPLTYEVIYGHAWKGISHRTNLGTETRVSVTQIKRA